MDILNLSQDSAATKKLEVREMATRSVKIVALAVHDRWRDEDLHGG